MFKALVVAIRAMLSPLALLEGDAGITAILGIAGQIFTQLLTWFSSLSTWIIGDSLAGLYIGMMIIMFLVVVFLTVLKKG